MREVTDVELKACTASVRKTIKLTNHGQSTYTWVDQFGIEWEIQGYEDENGRGWEATGIVFGRTKVIYADLRREVLDDIAEWVAAELLQAESAIDQVDEDLRRTIERYYIPRRGDVVRVLVAPNLLGENIFRLLTFRDGSRASFWRGHSGEWIRERWVK